MGTSLDSPGTPRPNLTTMRFARLSDHVKCVLLAERTAYPQSPPAVREFALLAHKRREVPEEILCMLDELAETKLCVRTLQDGPEDEVSGASFSKCEAWAGFLLTENPRLGSLEHTIIIIDVTFRVAPPGE